MYKHFLVPLDDSALSAVLAGDAVRFAAEQGARITFFHSAPDYLATSDGAIMHALSPQDASRLSAGDAHSVLNKAEAGARAAGVPCSSFYKVSNRVGQAIIDAASQHGCDLIFTATRGPKSVGNVYWGSSTVELLAHSPVPVLVSSVARAQAEFGADRAIGIIEDEHRSLAAVLHGMRRLLDRARAGGGAPDFALLKLMIFYIRKFPEELHHPKEDSVLFARLQARTGEVDAILDELRRQHAERGLLDELSAALASYESGEVAAEARFADCLDRFTAAEWKHMGLEERVILPAARRSLTDEDWAAVTEAFSGNRTPHVPDVPEEAFKRVFAKIMQDASPVPRE